jgi:hypothetical protein
MHKVALGAIAVDNSDDIAKDVELDFTLVETLAMNFAIIATRIKVVDGELDFELPAHNATSEQFKVCFNDYLDSQYAALMDEVVAAINELDRAQDPDLLPGLIIPDNEKKS